MTDTHVFGLIVVPCILLLYYCFKKFIPSFSKIQSQRYFGLPFSFSHYIACGTISVLFFADPSIPDRRSTASAPNHNSVSNERRDELVDEILYTLHEHQVRDRHTKSPRAGHINITTFPIDPKAIKAVPAKVTLHYKFLPLELHGRVLKIAVSSLNNVTILDDLRIFLGFEVIPFLAREEDIIAGINQYYGIGAETIQSIFEDVNEDYATDDAATHTVTDIHVSAEEEASIIRFVNKIFFEAYQSRATDIHIEPYADELRIRYRIDGELVKLNVPPELVKFKSSIISRIKVMASLDIAERRLPQDGRAKIKVNSHVLDMRLSTLPTAFGESINIRLLASPIQLDLHALGFGTDDVAHLHQMIAKTHGIILAVGPTGSGKTSTLYTCLSKVNTEQRKIITIEDPVEYNLEGITQMQTKSKIGFTFANGLRSILRHDPDIMMVGEIRDRETADIAFRSALTGHLVFSTLHTNNASQAVTRLLDLGLEAYLIADALEGVIAQRLVRVLCSHCKERTELSPEDMERYCERILGIVLPRVVYQARGCRECNQTGFNGRTVMYEILSINKDIKKLIHQQASADVIHRAALANGMRSLAQSGIQLVMHGITTVDEVLKAT